MVCLTPQLSLLVYLHMNVGPPSLQPTALASLPANTLPTPVLQPLPCHESSPPQLPVSIPPTGLDECFFFNSLVVGLTYSSIFCQFWLVFVSKFVVVLLVVQGSAVCLPMPPSCLEVNFLLF